MAEEQEGPVQVKPKRTKGGRVTWGLLAALLVGGGLALLLAPNRGRDLQRQAAQRAQELWRRRQEVAARGQARATQAAQQVGRLVQETPLAPALEQAQRGAAAARSQLAEAIAAGRQASRQASWELRSRYEALVGRRHPEG